MFASALAAVRCFGGVLEHPRYSAAWATFGLPRPVGPTWQRNLFDEGWVCEIDQAEWGLVAHKPTWLYYVGPKVPPVLVGTHDASAARPGPKDLHSGHRHLTPPALRDALLDLVKPNPPRTRGQDLTPEPATRPAGTSSPEREAQAR